MEITVKTPRGTFTGPLFRNAEEAKANGYGIYFTADDYEVYTKHIDYERHLVKFAFIPYHRPNRAK